MNFDKSNSPVWVKIVVWTIVFAFVAGALAIGITPLIQNWQRQKAVEAAVSGTADLASIEKIHLPGIKVAEKSIESTASASVDQMTDLATRYTQYAYDLAGAARDDKSVARYNEVNQRAHDLWLAAYEKSPTKEIKGDLATSFYYIGDVDSAIKTAKEVLAEYPDYATVWFNLGFYQMQSDPEASIEAFENAVKYDKEGKFVTEAKNQIANLKSQLEASK